MVLATKQVRIYIASIHACIHTCIRLRGAATHPSGTAIPSTSPISVRSTPIGTVSAFVRPFENRLLWGAIALTVVLQIVVVHVPFMNEAFDTAPLDLGRWLICAALASSVLFADELRKLFHRGVVRSR